MPASRKGDRRERELVNKLDSRGFTVLRAPSSGSATKRDLPDVLVNYESIYYGIEAKSGADEPKYIDGSQVYSLYKFCSDFSAKPRIGVRFDREDWYFLHPAVLYVTDGGNYRITKKKTKSEGNTINELKSQKDKSMAETV